MIALACGVDAMRLMGLPGCDCRANSGCAHFATRSDRGLVIRDSREQRWFALDRFSPRSEVF